MIDIIIETRDFKINADNHLELHDLDIGDEVYLKYSKEHSKSYNDLIHQGHRFLIVKLNPLTACLTSSQTWKSNKVNSKFPYNYEYYDDEEVIVKVDAYVEINVDDIYRIIDYDIDEERLKDVLISPHSPSEK